MSNIQVSQDGFSIEGEINFSNIHIIEGKLLKLLQKSDKFVNMHLDGVVRCDSSLLALLLMLVNSANKAGKSIKFHNAPQQLKSIAKLSGLEGHLAI